MKKPPVEWSEETGRRLYIADQKLCRVSKKTLISLITLKKGKLGPVH